MAEAITTKVVRTSFQPSFFFWMTVIMAGFVFSRQAQGIVAVRLANHIGPFGRVRERCSSHAALG